MRRLGRLRQDADGAASIEMAIGLPVLVVMIWGIFQVGVALQAIAGMQHGLGEAARLATICTTPNPLTGCANPSDTEIKDRVEAAVFGVGVGTFSDPSVTTPATTVCTDCRLVSVTFAMPMDFLFFKGPGINITRSKIVYLA